MAPAKRQSLREAATAPMFGYAPPKEKDPAPLRVLDLPARERPSGRIEQLGAPALSDSELLVAITGMPTYAQAQQVLQHVGGWHGLARADIADLRNAGLSVARAAQVKAALEAGRRLLLAAPDERLQIRQPRDLAALLQVELAHRDHEEFWVVSLDTKNCVQKMTTLYVGTVNTASLRVAEVFKDAIRQNSPAIIVAHNHPSGDPTPSPDDVAATRAIVEAGKILDIELLDHLIIGHGRFVSLREQRLGFA